MYQLHKYPGGSRRRLAAAGILTLVLAAVAACSSSGSSSSGGSGGSGGSASKGPVLVGGLMPLSGPVGAFGSLEKAAIDLAISQVNSHGGVLGGRKLKLITADTQGTSTGSVAGFQQLVAQKPAVIEGPILTAEVAPLVSLANSAKIPLLEGSTTQTVEKGQPTGSDWFFRTTETQTPQAAAQVGYAINTLHAKTAAILYSADELGQGYLSVVKAALAGTNLKLVASVSAPDTATDFTAQISALKAAHPDALFFINLAPQSATFLKQAKQQGLSIPVLTGSAVIDGVYYFHLAPGTDLPNGSLLTVPSWPISDTSDPGAKAFVTAYTKAAKAAPNDVSTGWYTSTLFLAAAISKAGSTDGAAIAKALDAMKNFTSFDGISVPTPPFQCDAQQNCDNSTLILTIKNGDLVDFGTAKGN
jgi:branched-chain amino acid transport system substrate-binding protein